MLKKILSQYTISGIFNLLKLNHRMKLVKYNKKYQSLLNLDINDYIEYSQIIIEIKPVTDITLIQEKNKFFNYIPNTSLNNYQIYFYFNNEKKNYLGQKIKRNYFTKREKVYKIKLYINHEITSLKNLFCDCKIIQEINFINFHRKNIINMESLFHGCSSLIKINLENFNTQNVINMKFMFYQCTMISELNLNQFNTNNVINMQKMFFDCRKLKKIFFDKKKFKFNKVNDMSFMFCKCYSLIDIDLSNINFNENVNMEYMFRECAKKLIKKIKEQNTNIKQEAFNS